MTEDEHQHAVAMQADWRAACDPATPLALLATIVEYRPDLRAHVASNPSAYPELLSWLSMLGDPAVDAALAARGGSASTVAPPVTTSEAPGTRVVPDGRHLGVDTADPAHVGPAVPPSSAPGTTSQLRVFTPGVVAAAILVLVLGGATGWALAAARSTSQTSSDPAATSTPGSDGAVTGSGATPQGSETDYVTKCGTPPTFTPEQVVDEDGALEVVVVVRATCPSGDVLSGPDNQVVVNGPSSASGSGSADAVVAAGTFDFSDDPLYVPESGVRLTLTFGEGHFFRTARDIDVTTVLVQCTPDPSTAPTGVTADPGSGSGAAAGPSSGAVVTTSSGAVTTDSEQDSADALRWQADHDRPSVLGTLDGKWTPQLSSKKPGLVADGRTWDNTSTLAEFLRLRQRYPDTLLLNSDEWSVFDAGGHWWVTIAGVPFDTAAEANSWCDEQGLDGEHCYAKYIDPGGTPEHTTEHR
ncbi:variant leucine-rich repeat-containing protein [Actinomyces provencensis]|uniref:variant leucine-rich repeat-containing protein n=1 Tax=Actinomyces provencensis TaxID=1720198 RepID=UPI001178022C|nr:hypothetical protein [Actinomyces provencensis]